MLLYYIYILLHYISLCANSHAASPAFVHLAHTFVFYLKKTKKNRLVRQRLSHLALSWRQLQVAGLNNPKPPRGLTKP